jgi:hypothetical protein
MHKYEADIESKIIESRNNASFYNYVNKKLSSSSKVGMLLDEQYATSDEDKANLLNRYFSSVNVKFTTEMIIRLCKKIKPTFTCDPDNYTPYLLKRLINVLAYPLSHIFNSLMSIGKIPSAWKKAVVTPLFKKGQSSNPSNYRPISLTSIFCKLMERGVVLSVLEFLQTNNLLNRHQHGFLSKKSTKTNLLETVSD